MEQEIRIQEQHQKNRFEMVPTGNTGSLDVDSLRLNCHSIIKDSKTGHLILSFYDDVENKTYKALSNWTSNKTMSFDILGYNGDHEVVRKVNITFKSDHSSWFVYTDFSWSDVSSAPSMELVIRLYDIVHTRF